MESCCRLHWGVVIDYHGKLLIILLEIIMGCNIYCAECRTKTVTQWRVLQENMSSIF